MTLFLLHTCFDAAFTGAKCTYSTTIRLRLEIQSVTSREHSGAREFLHQDRKNITTCSFFDQSAARFPTSFTSANFLDVNPIVRWTRCPLTTILAV